MNVMRILFIIPTLGSGGAERVVTLLANSFAQKNEIAIFCIENENKNDYGLSGAVTVKSANVAPRRGRKLLAVFDFIFNYGEMRRQLTGYIREYKPNVVVSILPKADFITYRLRNIGGFKWISSERNDPWARSFFERALLKRIYSKCDCLICQTKNVENYYLKAGIVRTVIIPNPVNSYHLSENMGFIEQYGRFAISIGRLDRQKNYEMLIDAFSMAIKNIEFTYKLLIIGDGVLKDELQKQIDRLRLTEQVLLLGRQSNVQDYINRAEFFVMSSDYEGMPNALLEAMNGELPVICTDVRTGAARELIDDSNGYLVQVGDTDGMSKALICMMTLSVADRMRMGEDSHRKVADLKIDNVIHRWEKLFSELVD